MANTFGNNTARRLLEIANATQPVDDNTSTKPQPLPDYQFRPRNVFRNDSSETVPPYGLLRVTGLEDERYRLLIDKPDGSPVCVVNGPRPVEAGRQGAFQHASQYQLIATQETTGEVGPGTTWEAVRGAGFTILGVVQEGLVLACRTLSTRKLIGVTNSAVSFGDSVQVTIYASATPGQAPAPVTPQRIETAWFDWSEENSPSDIEKGTRVFIFFCREDSRWRIIRFRGGPGISKGTSVADLSSGSVGAFSVTVDGESRLVNAQAIGDIAADARVVIFETPDGSLCAFQPGGSVFCGDLGLSPGTYRATVDGESSAGGSYDITLLDVQSENDVGVAENITLPNVSSWAGGDYAMGAEVLLHVDDQCNHWITNSLPRACDNTLIDGVSYPGRLSPSTDSSSGADMVEVYLEDDALTQSQRDSLGANNIVNAKWWADVCPRREQRVMVHVINCTLYATASLVLRDIPESTDSSSGVSILGIENGCVVTVPTDEGCAE